MSRRGNSKGKGVGRKAAKGPAPEPVAPAESLASEATTVAWTVTTMTVLLCDVAAVAARLYARSAGSAGQGDGPEMLANLLLLAAVVFGAVSLVLLPVVYRVRRVAPPRGLAVFAACVAGAPILAVLALALR